MRHAKRGTLTTEDVNDALRLRNVQVCPPCSPHWLSCIELLQVAQGGNSLGRHVVDN